MITFICLFFPAVLSVCLYENMIKQDLSRKRWIYRYCISVMLINFLCFGVKKYLLGTGMEIFGGLQVDVTPSAAFNYLLMAAAFAVVTAFMQVLLSKHAAIEVEAKNL